MSNDDFFTRGQLRQIGHMLRPLRNRIGNSIARGLIGIVDEAKKLQMLQLGLNEGEDGEDCENFQGFGFKSVPLPGAEAVALFPDGDRGVPLVVGTEDRRYRPTDWDGGEAGVYNAFDAIVRLKADGTIEAGTAGGAKVALATKADIDKLLAVLDAWIVVGTDGGAALKTLLDAAYTTGYTAAGTSKLKAE
jgi:phage baseplate assembly protein V